MRGKHEYRHRGCDQQHRTPFNRGGPGGGRMTQRDENPGQQRGSERHREPRREPRVMVYRVGRHDPNSRLRRHQRHCGDSKWCPQRIDFGQPDFPGRGRRHELAKGNGPQHDHKRISNRHEHDAQQHLVRGDADHKSQDGSDYRDADYGSHTAVYPPMPAPGQPKAQLQLGYRSVVGDPVREAPRVRCEARSSSDRERSTTRRSGTTRP